MRKMERNKNKLAVRLAAIAMAFVFGAGIWGQSSVVSYASNTLGSQGNTLNNEAADPEVEAIVEENQEAAAGSTAAKVKVIESSVRVRTEASTSSDIAGNLSNGDEVDVVGETTGADGYLWYQITGSISGYVRSDLVEVTQTVEPVVEAPVEVPEEEVPETPVETPEAAPAEYAVVYADDGTGVSDWYLNDNINGTRYKVTELLNAEQTNANLVDTMEEETGTLRTIIIVLAVIIALLVVVVTILIFKLRSAYDDGYEYDDEEDEDEEEDDEEEDEEPRRRGGFLRRRASRYEDDEEDEEEDDEEEDDEEEDRYTRRAVRHARRDEAPRAASKKNYQSKNFLNVDEEEDMDFEFLDLK